MLNTAAARLGQFLNTDGSDVLQVVSVGGAIQYGINANGGIQIVAQPIAANGAIAPRVPGFYVITKGSIASLTLAAPTAGADDGLEIEIASNTAFAHVITATGLLLTASAAVNSITFPAFAGAAAFFTAYQGKWFVYTGGLGAYVTA